MVCVKAALLYIWAVDMPRSCVGEASIWCHLLTRVCHVVQVVSRHHFIDTYESLDHQTGQLTSTVSVCFSTMDGGLSVSAAWSVCVGGVGAARRGDYARMANSHTSHAVHLSKGV